MKKSLDLDAVRAFVLVADLASFTRAADGLQTAQAAISLKIKKLEDRLGYRLLDRTPRHVQLSEKGEAFIDLARDLLNAHDKALSGQNAEQPARVTIGISDHVAGPELPKMLQTIARYDPALSLEVSIAASRDLLEAFGDGQFDAVVFRREHDMRTGKVLFEEPVSWLAAPQFLHRKGEPLSIATLSSACGLRTLATHALDDAGIDWRETFVGGGVAAVGAAACAGLCVTVLATRLAPAGTVDIGGKLDLPALPHSQVTAKVRRRDRRTNEAINLFLAAFRGH
ncbi:LysR substrate-binding domain-containing protein [Anderseniella sp. Alg231-50]|uniref:LysR substrate-binding domain-containing protein n=1 Tax=Anderseniella sp. Alg231-50 TaxID=1922226 RepID=UPI000D54D3E1